MADTFCGNFTLQAAPDEVPSTEYTLTYWLDKREVIVEVGSGWSRFAQENDAPGLQPSRVIGRNLLDFVSGDVTRMYVHTLINGARMQGKPLIRQYRCDSPTTRRVMEMRLSMDPSGLLRWEHRLLEASPLPNPLAFRTIQETNQARFHVRCSVCTRLKSPRGWNDPEEIAGPCRESDGSIPVIYGVCPECLGTIHKRRKARKHPG